MDSAGPGCLIAGRYRLAAAIGHGGMGVVWRARDEFLGRDVALKELGGPACSSAQDRQAACRRAIREARMAARLSHRNVIRIYDIVEEVRGYPWIIMELLPPRSLHELVQREGPLSPSRAAEIGLGILAALRAAHAAGIVHRDVKPANIMLAADRVVLTDFGIALTAETSRLSSAGDLIGSPAYIAPERALGQQSGPPADLWGLGASLYAAVEGHGPFERDGGALATLTATVADDPEPAVHAGPLLGPVISGLLCKDPARRLAAADADRMLRRAAAARPGAAFSRPRRPTVPAARPAWLSGAAGPAGPAGPPAAPSSRAAGRHGAGLGRHRGTRAGLPVLQFLRAWAARPAP